MTAHARFSVEPCCPRFCSPDPWCDSVHITLKQFSGLLELNRVKKHIHNYTITALSVARLQWCHPYREAVPKPPSFLFPPTLPQIICCRGHPGGHPTTWVSGNLPISNASPLVTDVAAGRVAMAAHPSQPALLALGTALGSALPWLCSGLLPAIAQPPHSAQPLCLLHMLGRGCSVHGFSAQRTARADDQCPAEWHLQDPAHGNGAWGAQCLQLPAVLGAGLLWDGVTSPIQFTLLNECLISHHLKKHPLQNISKQSPWVRHTLDLR